MKKIDLYLLQGFLGSGKTSCLINLLEKIPNKKCGVIQNEFGKIGVDGRFFNQNNLEMIEIDNGSIFCACKHDNFIEALISMSSISIEVLFVEASGISDPSTLETDLNIVKSKIGDIFKHKGNICLIDSEYAYDLIEIMPNIQRQIEYANLLLINKMDLVNQAELDELKQKVTELNHEAKLIETQFGRINLADISTFFNIDILPVPKKSVNTPESRPLRLLLDFDSRTKKLSLSAFQQFINEIKSFTLRIKGFLLLDKQWHHIDGVQKHIKITKSQTKAQENFLNIIFPVNTDYELLEIIKKKWDKII